MDVKSTGSAAPTRTLSPDQAAAMQDMKASIAKVNKFLEEGPGGIFKPLNDFMAKHGGRPFDEVRREVLANIKG
jgi:hypothetical protein